MQKQKTNLKNENRQRKKGSNSKEKSRQNIKNDAINKPDVENNGLVSANGNEATGKKKLKHLDSVFVILILTMVVYGLIMVFSSSYAWSLNKFGNSFHFIINQALFVCGGLVGMFILSRIDYHNFRKILIPIVFCAIILLILVAIPGIGVEHNGARRWIDIKITEFQPSEIVKFALIVLFAHLTAHNYKRMGTFTYGVLPYVTFLTIVCVLMMLQPHLSGTILMLLIGSVMMIVGGTKPGYFVAVIVAAAAGIVAVLVLKPSYMVSRIQNWLSPFENVTESGWQTQQSLIAIGSGGIMGRGLGGSHQKFLYLPESHNDYIFAIICEELGLIGALIVIILFIAFTFRGFKICKNAPDKFGFMLGIGLVSQICIQAALNIAVVTNTIPSTGISLPFFSYGGTAILMQLGQMGVLLNISRQATMEKAA
ncbi:MAG: putative lipid II flippase FtsW [Oscillospiraceae bacterium]